MRFRTFIQQFDIFESGDINDHQILDGKWYPNLKSNEEDYDFYFNVPGDNCGNSSPCYKINFSVNQKGDTSISFNRQGSYSDQGRNVQIDVFKSISKATLEFIQTKNPEQITWSAIDKSTPNKITGSVVNKEARGSIYDKWALRNLFPDKYVGMNGKWTRRDIYDNEFIPKGYPPVPEGITDSTSLGVKSKIMEKMEQELKNNSQNIVKNTTDEMGRSREKRNYLDQQKMIQRLQDPEFNPNGLKIGDLVFNRDNQKVGKILNVDIHSSDYELYFKIAYQSGNGEFNNLGYEVDGYSVKASRLKKETPESAEERRRTQEEEEKRLADLARERDERIRQRQEEEKRKKQELENKLLGNPETNPSGLKIGDLVFYPARQTIGKLLKISDRTRDTNNFGYGYNYFDVAMQKEDGSFDNDTIEVQLNKLKKETPESSRLRETEYEDKIKLLANDRTINPEELKIGDNVVTHVPDNPESNQNGLLGVLKSFYLSKDADGEYSNHLMVNVDFDEHGRQIIGNNVGKPISISNFLKATPENIQKIKRNANRSIADRRIEASRRRNNRPQIEETPEEILNHPDNPQHFKIGDRVLVWNDIPAVITSVYHRNNGSFVFYVKLKGKRSSTMVSINDLKRDESPAVQQRIARQQNQTQRNQRIATANPQNIEIGDDITVTTGINRGKAGRVLAFRTNNNNIYINCVDEDNNQFIANIKVVSKNNQAVA